MTIQNKPMRVTQHIGIEKHYQLGLANGLANCGITIDQISNDEMMAFANYLPERIRLINLRGDQSPNQTLLIKILRIIRYYCRLFLYTITTENTLFHIHTENKFKYFDRTLLLIFYKILRKKIIITVHNVDAQARNGNSSVLNRLTLRIQYCLANRLIVHTEKMKIQLKTEFKVPLSKIYVIPIGINDQVPQQGMSKEYARDALNISLSKKVILFFGNIDPYKGLDILLQAFHELQKQSKDYLLLIAGRPKGNATYFASIEKYISENKRENDILSAFQFIPDEEIEKYFAAADCLILPYKEIYQSAVLVLAYSFGLPVVGTRVGNFEQDIVEGETGFLCRPNDPADLAKTISIFYTHSLFFDLIGTRNRIKHYARDKYSWESIGLQTKQVYESM